LTCQLAVTMVRFGLYIWPIYLDLKITE
jgi:hypothetical protein